MVPPLEVQIYLKKTHIGGKGKFSLQVGEIEKTWSLNVRAQKFGTALFELLPEHARLLAAAATAQHCSSSQYDLLPVPEVSPIPLMLAMLSLPSKYPFDKVT